MNIQTFDRYPEAYQYALDMRDKGHRARPRPSGGKWQVIIRDEDDPSLRTRISGTRGIGGRMGAPPSVPTRMPSPSMPRSVIAPSDDGMEQGWDRPEGTWTKPQTAGTGWEGIGGGLGRGPLKGMDMSRLRRRSHIRDRRFEEDY